jgi:hypothetical protein
VSPGFAGCQMPGYRRQRLGESSASEAARNMHVMRLGRFLSSPRHFSIRSTGRRDYPAATAIFLVFLSAFSIDKGLVTTCQSSKPIVAENWRSNAVNWLWRRKIRMKNPF